MRSCPGFFAVNFADVRVRARAREQKFRAPLGQLISAPIGGGRSPRRQLLGNGPDVSPRVLACSGP